MHKLSCNRTLASLRACVGCGVIALTATGRLPGAIYDYTLDDGSGRALRLNIPDDLATVRGILSWGNGGVSDGRDRATNGEFVAFARAHGFCVLATSGFAFYVADTYQAYLTGIERLAAMSGHPEITQVPWLPWGHSNGGIMSFDLAEINPGRTIAFAVTKASGFTSSRPGSATLATPGLCIAGELDTAIRLIQIRDLFDGNRPRGGLWAWAEEDGIGHSSVNQDDLIQPFSEEVLNFRYPDSQETGNYSLRAVDEASGWLVEPLSYKDGWARIYAYADYPGDRRTAGWLPSRRIAYIFRAFASYHKATASATLSSGIGPVEWGTTTTYALSQPVALWTAIEFYEGDTLLRRVTAAEGGDLAVTSTLTRPGYSVYHAVVNFADGTQRATTPHRVFVRAYSAQIPSVGPIAGSAHLSPGGTTTFSVTATGEGPLIYQWRKDGAAIAGATSATYTVANVQPGNMGFYSVTVSNGVGTVDSDVAILTVATGRSRLTGLSTRGYVPAGGSLTPGFYLRGSGTKAVIVRGVGPTLGSLGVASALSDPRMDLIPVGAATLLSNDNWGTSPDLPALRAAMPFALAEGSLDAAALATLSTATNLGYTVRIGPSGAATAGIAMAEVYDLDVVTSPVQFASLSTLGFTGTGDNVLTPGFIITGDGPKQLLIRAVGPTLGGAPYNVTGALADPQFRVVPLNQNFTVAGNDNWDGTVALQAAFAQTYAFALPAASRDAAAVVRLPPGGYTVQAIGVGNTTGNVLVEVYDMDP